MKKLNLRLKVVVAALALTIGVSFGADYLGSNLAAMDLSPIVDEYGGGEEIAEDEVPLASAPVVKTKTTTKTSTSEVKLKKKATSTKKTTTKNTKKSSVTKKTSTKKVKTETTVVTTVVKQTKKYSYIQKNTTTVKTTTKTTTTEIPVTKKTLNIISVAPKAHSNVVEVYNLMGMRTYLDTSVSYNGMFDASQKSITLKNENDEASYHELGHFVAFVSGNTDRNAEFQAIFNAEKSKFTATRGNTAYILNGGPIEYFADSYQDYVENPKKLKAERPKTYNYMKAQVAKVTKERGELLLKIYAYAWKDIK